MVEEEGVVHQVLGAGWQGVQPPNHHQLGDDQVQQLFVMFTSVVGGVLHNSSCRACQPGACLCRGSRSTPSSRSMQSGDPSSSGTLPLKRYESQT